MYIVGECLHQHVTTEGVLFTTEGVLFTTEGVLLQTGVCCFWYSLSDHYTSQIFLFGVCHMVWIYEYVKTRTNTRTLDQHQPYVSLSLSLSFFLSLPPSLSFSSPTAIVHYSVTDTTPGTARAPQCTRKIWLPPSAISQHDTAGRRHSSRHSNP